MAKELNDKQIKFIEKAQKHWKAKGEELAYKALAKFLKDDINIYDVFYVDTRVQQILEEAYKKVSYKDEEIAKLRTELLKQTTEKVKMEVRKLPIKKKDRTETDTRNERCEDSAQAIVAFLLDQELILSDEDYIAGAIADDDKLLLSIAVRGYKDTLFEVLLTTMQEHKRRAEKQLWGKDEDEVTFKELDSVLKSIKKVDDTGKSK